MSYSHVWDHMTREISTNMVQRDRDLAFIPNDMNNADWQEYQAWLLAGYTPAPPREPLPPVIEPDDPLPVPPAQAYQELLELTARVEALESQVARLTQ